MFWRAALVAAAAIAALVRLPPPLVERVYSTRVYAGLQPLLTSLSNLSPLALFDVLVLIVVPAFTGLAVRDLRRTRGWSRRIARLAQRALVWAAAIYLLFLALWGLNYRRVRLVDALAFDASRVTPAAAAAAAGAAVDHLNALYDRAHADGWPGAAVVDPALADALDRAVIDVGRAQVVVPGRPKAT